MRRALIDPIRPWVNRPALLLALGLPAALLLASLAGGGRSARASFLVPAWILAHALYLGAAWTALRPGAPSRVRATAPAPSGAATAARGRLRALALVLAVGLVPRLALLPTEPALSEDVYRYLWDGRLVAKGIEPYTRPPADPSLEAFRPGFFERLNHPEVPTVYPPAAQLLFAAAARVEPTPAGWKALLFALEALLLGALARLLAARGLPLERLLLYYWNPLVIVECYGNGHLDLAAAVFLLLALALHETRRPLGAGLALGTAILVKLTPALLLPALLKRRAWGTVAAAAAAVTLLSLPFAGAGNALGDGLRVYARHWEFNGPLYTLFRPAFPDGDGPRRLLAGLLAASLLAIAWRARTLSGAALASTAAFLLASPTLYPWYLVPAAALLPLHPDAGLLALTGLAALVYVPLESYRASGAWQVPPGIMAVEYGALLAVWGAAWTLRLRGGAAAARYERRVACTIESTPT